MDSRGAEKLTVNPVEFGRRAFREKPEIVKKPTISTIWLDPRREIELRTNRLGAKTTIQIVDSSSRDLSKLAFDPERMVIGIVAGDSVTISGSEVDILYTDAGSLGKTVIKTDIQKAAELLLACGEAVGLDPNTAADSLGRSIRGYLIERGKLTNIGGKSDYRNDLAVGNFEEIVKRRDYERRTGRAVSKSELERQLQEERGRNAALQQGVQAEKDERLKREERIQSLLREIQRLHQGPDQAGRVTALEEQLYRVENKYLQLDRENQALRTENQRLRTQQRPSGFGTGVGGERGKDPDPKGYYKILGISTDRDPQIFADPKVLPELIKAAYKRLGLLHHPDIIGKTPENTARFQRINEAYGVLSDEEKRKEYDKFGR